MNSLLNRWLNEYLDGEIGLADKAQLEQRMAADPQLRRRYTELRQIGLHLAGGMPEVRVSERAFRQRMADALDQHSSVFLTPQRAFAGAMLVTLLVLLLSFTLLMFQSKLLGGGNQPAPLEARVIAAKDWQVRIQSGTSADRFLSRMLVEGQLGMLDPAALQALTEQTNVLEKATCTDDPLNPVRLGRPAPGELTLRVAPSVAMQLSKVAESLSGRTDTLSVLGQDGEVTSLEQYLRAHPGSPAVDVRIIFQQ